MPELRKDPVVGRWVIIATERARRPGNIIDSTYAHPDGNDEECPFCHEQEQPIYNNGRGVSVIPFKNSFLQTQDGFVCQKHGLYDVINGFGTHEVVIETPQHISDMADLDIGQIQGVLETYRQRMTELERQPSFRYVLAFKNHGAVAGSRKIDHTRSHVMATPNHPLRVKEKLTGAKNYYQTKRTCVYCDCLQQELKTQKRIVMETDHFVALTPFAARFLFEIWILPKRHHCDYTSGVEGKEHDLAKILKMLLMKFKIGLDGPAYNYIIQTAPFRRGGTSPTSWATIEKDFHWHIELMPRLTRTAGFEKGTGFYICTIPPEKTAEYLKQVDV